MLFDVKSYRESLKTKYNIPDEDLAPFADKGEITQGFMRQDDYSRKSQQLQQMRNELQEYEVWVKSLEAAYGPREQWSEAFARAVGQQNPSGSGEVTPAGLSEAEVQRRIDAAVRQTAEQLSQQFSSQLEVVGRGAAAFAEFYFEANDYFRETYGTKLPKDEFKKFFDENGHTDPRIALKLFEQPYAEKKREKEVEDRIARATQEAEQRVRSQYGIVDGGGSQGGWAGGKASSISVGAAAGINPFVDDTPAPAGGNAGTPADSSGQSEPMSRSQLVEKFNTNLGRTLDKLASSGTQ